MTKISPDVVAKLTTIGIMKDLETVKRMLAREGHRAPKPKKRKRKSTAKARRRNR